MCKMHTKQCKRNNCNEQCKKTMHHYHHHHHHHDHDHNFNVSWRKVGNKKVCTSPFNNWSQTFSPRSLAPSSHITSSQTNILSLEVWGPSSGPRLSQFWNIWHVFECEKVTILSIFDNISEFVWTILENSDNLCDLTIKSDTGQHVFPTSGSLIALLFPRHQFVFRVFWFFSRKSETGPEIRSFSHKRRYCHIFVSWNWGFL